MNILLDDLIFTNISNFVGNYYIIDLDVLTTLNFRIVFLSKQVINYDNKLIIERELEYNIRRRNTFIRYYNNSINDLNKLNITDINDKIINNLYDSGSLEILYNINKSITQSLRSTSGKKFELLIENILKQENISYASQVYIENDKIIKTTSHKKNINIVDFLIPNPKIGDSLSNYIILSCKTSLRDRTTQDFHLKSKQTIVITLDPKLNKKNNGKILYYKVINNKIDNNLTNLINYLKQFRLVS